MSTSKKILQRKIENKKDAVEHSICCIIPKLSHTYHKLEKKRNVRFIRLDTSIQNRTTLPKEDEASIHKVPVI